MLFSVLTAAGNGTTTNSWLQMLPSIGIILVLVVAFYFMLIRPQRKREKQETEMRSNLSVGDEVTTTGGIIGRIVSIKEDTVVIETGSDRVKIKMLKASIASNETIHD